MVRKRRTHKYRKAEGEALIAQHLLERKFEPGAINRVWERDITYASGANRAGRIWLSSWTCTRAAL